MLNTRQILLAIATLAIVPVVNAQSFFFGTEEGAERAAYRIEPKVQAAAPKAADRQSAAPAFDGFKFVGGDTGWEPAQHKLAWVGGKVVHTNECDHAIRMVKTPTPAELDAVRARYPG